MKVINKKAINKQKNRRLEVVDPTKRRTIVNIFLLASYPNITPTTPYTSLTALHTPQSSGELMRS